MLVVSPLDLVRDVDVGLEKCTERRDLPRALDAFVVLQTTAMACTS